MTSSRTIWFVALLGLLPAAAMGDELVVEFTPLPTEGGQALLCPVQMAITNQSEHELDSLSVRWEHGGPTIVIPATIAPAQRIELTSSLPAIATTQTFAVTATGPAQPLSATATIVWPEPIVDAGGLIAPDLYDRLVPDACPWSSAQRRRILLIALGAALLLAAAAMLRQSKRRLIALLLIVAACTVGVGVWASAHVYVDERIASDGRHLLLQSRRTVTWRSDRMDLAPLYASRQHLMEDMTVIGPDQTVLTLPSGQPQLLRLPAPVAGD